jgi:hypothetical protein
MVAWDTNVLDVSCPRYGGHSLSVKVTSCSAHLPSWSLTTVYSPQEDPDKMQEIRDIHALLVAPGSCVVTSTSFTRPRTRITIGYPGE